MTEKLPIPEKNVDKEKNKTGGVVFENLSPEKQRAMIDVAMAIVKGREQEKKEKKN